MIAFGWLLVGAVLSLGRWAVSALPVIGGVCMVLALILLGCISVHAATWAIRREREIEQAAQAGPDDTIPLTSYELAIIALLTGGQADHINGSSE